MTQRYCLLGEDVSRSLSPQMMNAAFEATGIDARYDAVSLRREEFKETFMKLRDEAKGMNLTIPYKSEVIPLLDHLDEVAQRIGAANVVKTTTEGYEGYNSDVNGITEPLRERGLTRVKSALLIGAGGAARAFCEAMSQLGGAFVTVAVRDRTKGDAFVAEMATVFPQIQFRCVGLDALGGVDTDLVFNATSIGTVGQPLPEAFKRVIYGHAAVFDAVYRPMKTELLRAAEEKGSPIIFGYEMLLSQGTLAFEIWTEKRAPKEVMRSALRDSLEAGS